MAPEFYATVVDDAKNESLPSDTVQGTPVRTAGFMEIYRCREAPRGVAAVLRAVGL